MSGAIATAAIVGGGLAGAGISAWGANKAAGAQVSAADHAADLQYKASQDALAFQKQQYNTSRSDAMPWLNSGKSALSQLDYLMGIGGDPTAQAQGAKPVGPQSTFNPTGNTMQPANGTPAHYQPIPTNPTMPGVRATAMVNGTNGPSRMLPAPGTSLPGSAAGPAGSAPTSGINPALGGYGSLMAPNPFQAPTGLTMENDPGYQARLNLGTDTLQRSAAARGNLLTGGTAKALENYSQDYASNEYGNVYNRAFNTYSANEADRSNRFNRLSGMAGMGQQTAQSLGTLGQNAANGVTGNLLSTANNMGEAYQNAGAATASGYYNTAGAITNGINGAANNLWQYKQLQGMWDANSADSFYSKYGY